MKKQLQTYGKYLEQNDKGSAPFVYGIDYQIKAETTKPAPFNKTFDNNSVKLIREFSKNLERKIDKIIDGEESSQEDSISEASHELNNDDSEIHDQVEGE